MLCLINFTTRLPLDIIIVRCNADELYGNLIMDNMMAQVFVVFRKTCHHRNDNTEKSCLHTLNKSDDDGTFSYIRLEV